MDENVLGDVAAWVAVVVALAAAGIASYQARIASRQARSASEQAVAAMNQAADAKRQADAAEKQVSLMEGQLASAEADRNEIRIAKHRESLSDILFKSREILINLKRLFLLAADHNLSYSATRKQVSELIEAVVTKRSEFDHILLSAGMHSPKDAPPPVHKLHNIMAAISHFATGLLDDITKGEVIDREKKEELLNKIWGTATEVEADITYYLSLLAGSGESTKSVDN